MPRQRRKQEPGRLYFATTRCLEQRFLLSPSGEVNARILGWLGRAMKKYPSIRVYGIIVMANHLHLILSSGQVDLDRFMGYWLGNVAKEVNRLRGRRGKLFEDRYKASAILDDEAARTKLAYLLLNPTAAKLVGDPAEWPGITSLDAQTGDVQLVGCLPDREELKRRRRRREQVTEADVMVEYPITISPLPEFEGRDIEGQRHAVRDLIRCELETVRSQLAQEEAEAAGEVGPGSLVDVHFMGVDAILAQDPNGRPKDPAFSPQPMCHASSAEAKALFVEECANVERAYDQAMERYLAGKVPNFPPGTCPPGWARAIWPADEQQPIKSAA